MTNSASQEGSFQLSNEQVRHIASLARIGMTESDIEKFRHELSSIIAHFDVLAAIDTEAIIPTNNGADSQNVMVADKARASTPIEKTITNAPNLDGHYFRVRAVLE